MSTNPFTNYPFWHHFTLHLQNIPYMSDDLRLIKIGTNFITFDPEKRTAKTDSLTEKQKLAIERAVFNSRFYDYANDKIVDANSIDMNRVILVDTRAIVVDKKVMDQLMSKYGIKDPLFLIKKGAEPKKDGKVIGGEIYPIIGDQESVKNYLDKIAGILFHLKDSQKNPMPNLTSFDEQFERLQNTNDLYENPLIKSILKAKTFFEPEPQEVLTSMERAPTIDFDKYRQQLISTFSSSIPSDKAINIKTGRLAKKSNNIIVRKRVKIPSNNKTMTVEFAYPSKMTESSKKLYEDFLKKNFVFEDVAETVVSESKMQFIGITPIMFTENTYSSIFGKDTGFRTYFQKENDSINYNPIDSSQSLQTLKKITEETSQKQEEEEYLSEEEEEEEYEEEEVMSEEEI